MGKGAEEKVLWARDMGRVLNPGSATCLLNASNGKTRAGARSVGLSEGQRLEKRGHSCHHGHLSHWTWAGLFVRRGEGGKTTKNERIDMRGLIR